jgi:hypothetical protein
MREIRTSGSMSGGTETEPWIGLRHRRSAKAAGEQLSPSPAATAPSLDSTRLRVPETIPRLAQPCYKRVCKDTL